MTVQVRSVTAADGVVISVSGAIGDREAALLSRCLHAQLESEPALLVVDLSRVPSCDHTGRHVLGLVRERAEATGTELRLADLGHPDAREWLTEAGLL
ncbi:STAS domain-containing protein [Actinomycetospora sp. TBRC 11914]|uniref:STAS domain-containing protein n=1 Tax=Actinomycetospora sp. TBRC 11914 TaxID=2729387 RepID=UPI00145D6C1A|nr:STAS domain-containing protein [Actinomycetospora sp. TBRC 11914]NMO91311.1 STAS domain-containing protein [Actinomycetospora sp. TBRC 11914]